MQVKDMTTTEYNEMDSKKESESTSKEHVVDGTMLDLDQFQSLNLLGLDIEIEFSDSKKEVLKNVQIRSVEKSIKGSSDSIKKVITFEARDIEK